MNILGVLFFNLDVTLLVLFGLALGAFIYWEWRRGEKLEVQQLVPYVLYFIMYRTKWGLKKMDAWAKRYSSWLRITMPLIITVGLIGMVMMSIYMAVEFVKLFTAPSGVAPAQLVLPIQSDVTFYVPFFYWIIAIFLIAAVHEFAHGVVARYYKMRVKSSGFAFLGFVLPIIPAAFVEPDEKQILKKPWEQQVAVYGAGPFINVVFAIVALLVVSLAFAPIAQSVVASDVREGIGISTFTNGSGLEAAGVDTDERIVALDGMDILNASALQGFLETTQPGQSVEVTTNEQTYAVELGSGEADHGYLGFMPRLPVEGALGEHPAIVQNFVFAASGYSGLYPEPPALPAWLAHAAIWLIGLLFFLFILNLGIGLFNLLPIFIADGARILWVTLKEVFGMDEKRAGSITFMVGWVMLVILFVLIVLPLTPLYGLLVG